MITTLVATTRVPWTGAVNKQMTFGLKDSQYIISNIDGLGPLRAELISSELPSDPGTKYLSSRQLERNIVITMGFAIKPGSTVETLRRNLSNVFTPTYAVELTFTDDVLGTYIIRGRVESADPTIFAKEPEIQISILCHDPFFYSTMGDVVFTIPALTPFNEQFTINYTSDVPVGFSFEYDTLTGPSTGQDYIQLSLNETPVNANGRDPFMRLQGNFQANDHFRISSARGDRGAWRTRGTAVSSMMPYFTGSLTRMLLKPGLNYLALFPVLTGSGAKARNAKITYKRIRGSL